MLIHTPPDICEVAPPAVKVDTTTIADDDPSTVAASAVTTLRSTWNNWLNNQTKPFTKERCATENQPENRDIFSVGIFKGKNDHLVPIVYPWQKKSYYFEEFIFSTSTGMDATKMAIVKKEGQNTEQTSLSASDTTPKYICGDILRIHDFSHTIFSNATQKTEIINVAILIIQLSQHASDELASTMMVRRKQEQSSQHTGGIREHRLVRTSY